MTGSLIDYPPFHLNRVARGTGGRRGRPADTRLHYLVRRLVELIRAPTVGICDADGCPGSPHGSGRAPFTVTIQQTPS